MALETPVAMMVFSRPEKTLKVFETVRAARPRRLLVVADGPRPTRAGEAERCAAVRAIFDRVDWPCEIERDFSEENLGCRRRLSSGVDWVFSRCEEAIFLEDDCLPHPTFFPYCEELLRRYRDEPRVMAVGGVNFQDGQLRGTGSYYFSTYLHVWGWASWRRAWRAYDVAMSSWPARRSANWLAEKFRDPRVVRYWTELFDRTHAGEIPTWDYQWLYAIWERGGLVASPNVNLVTNFGAGAEATNTQATNRWFDLPTVPVELPLRHPAALAPDAAADAYVQRTHFARPRRKGLRGIWQRLTGE